MPDSIPIPSYAETIATLERKLRSLKRDITGIADFGKAATLHIEDTALFEARLEANGQAWDKFQVLWDELCEMKFLMDEVFPTESWQGIYDSLRDELLEAKASLLRIERQRRSQAPLPDPRATFNSTGPNASRSGQLPTIPLPQFSGDMTQWSTFKSTFKSLVNDDATLSNVAKFHYLVGALKGEAASLIAGFPKEDLFYEQAWNKLVSTYDNPRVLASMLVHRILNCEASKESNEEKRYELFLTGVADSVEAFRALNLDHPEEFLLSTLALRALDPTTRKQFELSLKSSESIPSTDDITKFVRHRKVALQMAQDTSSQSSSSSSTSHFRPSFKGRYPKRTSNKYNSVSLHSTGNSSPVQSGLRNHNANASAETLPTNKFAKSSCLQCRGAHHLSVCKVYGDLPLSRRIEKAKAWRACFNCLSRGHMLDQCTSRFNCRECARRHHTLLHGDVQKNETTPKADQEPTETPNCSFTGFGSTPGVCSKSRGIVLLGTVRTMIKCSNGNLISARAVLDSGSQQSFITSSLAARLGYKLQPYKGIITSLAGAAVPQCHLRGSMTCTLRTCDQNEQYQIQAIVVDRITSALPTRDLPPYVVENLRAHVLADPKFGQSAPVELLLGGDLFPRIVSGASLQTEVDNIYLLPTTFGLVVSGKLCSSSTDAVQVFFTECRSNIDEGIRKFWEVEEPHHVDRTHPDDQYCEDHFVHTHSRTPSGRFVVRLPVKREPTQLGDNRDVAIRRFLTLEQKFQKNSSLMQHYVESMRGYKELNHMSNAPSESPYLIPHHGVWQHGPQGKKLRVVFDASCPSSKGSLNDMLLAGPKLQGDLCCVLIRFRLYKIALCADLVKMYRQILVHPDDRHLQHIVWRENPTDPLQEEELNTVTYGLKSSAFQAIRSRNELAKIEAHRYPLAAKKISTDMYVDDFVSGADTEEEAFQLQRELCELFSKGGFTLGKWASTLPHLVPNSDEKTDSKLIRLADDDQFKILGLQWNSSRDSFGYMVHAPPTNNVTKRAMLSSIARIFDPLGLLAPVIFVAKSLIQSVWKANIDWDQELPPDLASHWRQLVTEWYLLSTLTVPRYISCLDASYMLVGFCDASTKGYAASLYLRCEGSGSLSPKVSLIKAKTKVAPLKFLSVARLELCGALLLSRLVASVPEFLRLSVVCFTDSEIVLAWLKSPLHGLKVFEANRVSQIVGSVPAHHWRHVSSEDNPADLASRGCNPRRLIEERLWWSGPSWLQSSVGSWFQPTPQDVVMSSFSVKPSDKGPDHDWLSRFSSLRFMVRTVARILRFFKRVSASKSLQTGPITAKEYQDAEMRCIACVQRSSLPPALFKENTQIPRDFAQLSPFLDERGIIRVGGRLQESPLDASAKHPMLLPPKSHLARLIIHDLHEEHFHCGATLTLALLRNKYWVPQARKLIRSCVSRCVKCRILKAKPVPPLMSSLPKERFSQFRAFIQVGVDYAGPFLLKESRRRKSPIGKAYLCLFVCMASKAVHLEVVSSLTTSAFLDALDRFIARRGMPSSIWSDHGTNFVGASRFLRDVYKFQRLNEDTIIGHLAPRSIEWKFIPPRAPHFGGLWEAGVKSAKGLLVRALGSQPYLFEDLTTALAKIECLLNSRPICPLSEDVQDFKFLTPGHFLAGASLSLLPEPSITLDSPRSTLAAWRSLQTQISFVWERWRKEYLHTLQQRAKWTHKSPGLKVGDLVVLLEKRTLLGQWPVGRVTHTFPGRDGTVRAVNVRTPSGNTLTRAVTSLVPLFVPEGEVKAGS